MSLSRIIESMSRWIDGVTEMVVAALGRFMPVRRTQFIEEDDGTFWIQKSNISSDSDVRSIRLLDDGVPAAMQPVLAEMIQGREVEIVLRPDHFLVRPLELPKRAGEFLDGIVRSQIDRLTPWSAADAVFGWTPPAGAPDGRISLMIVATARSRIEPYVQALAGFGAHSIAVSMLREDGATGVTAVRVFAQGGQGALRIARVRRWLFVVLAGALLAAVLATIAAQFVGDDLEAQTRDVNRRIAERRAALIKGRNATAGVTTVQQVLEQRKHESAASVMVLEALSEVLPDHTYITELHVEDDKVQIIGVTREAPSLIQLMERSPHFTRATFFAPTTRSPGDPGERFHIEARIKPVFAANQ